MASPSQQPRLLRFGNFELDPQAGELRKHGLKIKLQQKPLQVLGILLERPGEVVSREELQKRLWPEGVFVDFDHGLNTAIKKLRDALGDTASTPRYIATVDRQGYRFVAPVSLGPPPTVDSGQGGATVTPVSVPQRQTGQKEPGHWDATRPASLPRRWLKVVAPVVVTGIVIAYFLFSPLPPPRVIAFQQTAASDRAEGWEPLLTDGARVYFLERAGDHWNVMQTSVAGGDTRSVAVPFPNTRIFGVSPDHSEFLIGGFETPAPKRVRLWIWPVQGGAPVRVGEILADDASWAPNGQEIIYTRDREIRIVRHDGSNDRLLLRSSGDPGRFHWSPDGTRLSFTVGDSRTGAAWLWEVDADGKNPHRRFRTAADEQTQCCGDWTADGKYFLYSSMRNGIYNLWAVREKGWFPHWTGRSPVQLTSAPASCHGALPIGNGDRIFAFVQAARFETVKYTVAWSEHVPVLPYSHGVGLEFSPDSQRVVFTRMPDSTLWRSRSDGLERVLLASAPLHVGHPHWSPDGTQIAFEARMSEQPTRAFVINAEGGSIQDVLPQQPGMVSLPVWSPDGRSLAVAVNVLTNDPKLARGVYIVDWKSRKASKIPASEGLTSPIWSPDGKVLIAKTFDDHKILRFEQSASRWVEIVSGNDVSNPAWSHDSRFLYFQDVLEPGEPVYRLRMGDLKREKVFSFESLLSQGAARSIFIGFAPDRSPIVELTYGVNQVYAVNLDLP